jgi:hypothetical protein
MKQKKQFTRQGVLAKQTLQGAAALLALAFVMGMAACASFGGKGKKMDTPTQYTILDHQGAATGKNELPQWLTVYLDSGRLAAAVEKLPAFRGMYCFIGSAESPNKLFAQRWAASVDAPAIIATMIHSRVEGMIDANEQLSDTEKERATTMSQATNFAATASGARLYGNWWIQRRVYDPDNRKIIRSEDYEAYALYTFDKDQFNTQLAAAMQRDLDAQSKLSIEERRIYTDLIQRVIQRGLDLEPDETSSVSARSGALAGALVPGTYTFDPRPQAVRGSARIKAYLNKMVVSNEDVRVYITGTATGIGDTDLFSSTTRITMRDLDIPSRVYNSEYVWNADPNQTFLFASVQTRRFSLTSHDDPPAVFKEIAVGAPDA